MAIITNWIGAGGGEEVYNTLSEEVARDFREMLI